ncbi:hypothetical protein BC827DRAFT_664568 [Russula dissimulans]|nr:hypothetical protein BC827DRAFT_664568 [Russula dissimulans]
MGLDSVGGRLGLVQFALRALWFVGLWRSGSMRDVVHSLVTARLPHLSLPVVVARALARRHFAVSLTPPTTDISHIQYWYRILNSYRCSYWCVSFPLSLALFFSSITPSISRSAPVSSARANLSGNPSQAEALGLEWRSILYVSGKILVENGVIVRFPALCLGQPLIDLV